MGILNLRTYFPDRKAVTKRCIVFLDDETGATAVEYALIATFIMLACVVTLSKLGDAFLPHYTRIASMLSSLP